MDLREAGAVRTMLVVAPLRVCRQVWRQEAAKWTQFKDLSFALLHGPKKDEKLKSGADIYLVNPEGVEWLCNRYLGRSLPFDVVAIDELTKFQNPQAQRHKALRPRLGGVRYRWGLTGSLFAKGHMGVFGQQLILDDGAALGRYITHYRDTYFHVGFNGFDYDLLPGAERRIIAKMAPYWFYMDDSDYAQLPEVVNVPRQATMDKAQSKLYRQMRDDMVANLPSGQVTAANAGACYTKLAQMANGAVYMDGPRGRVTVKLHDLKLEMLDELVDELDGESLLIGYEFNSDLERLQEWWRKRSGEELPYLGKGTTARQEDQWVRQWNNRELTVMAAHPQSASHGLNMQEGQACNVAWFSVTWDWELYDQFIRRVRRSGNRNAQVFNHLLIIFGTIDELKLAAVDDKNLTESHLIVALTNAILLEEQQGITPHKESTMVAKLSRPAETSATATTAGPANGWGQQAAQQQTRQDPPPSNQQQGTPAGWGTVAGPDPNADQRQRIQEQVAPQDRTAQARSAFSGGVQQAQQNVAQGDYGPVSGQDATTTQQHQAAAGWGQQAAAQGQQATQAAPTEEKPKRSRSKAVEAAPADDLTERLAVMGMRASIVAAIAQSDPEATVEDIVDAARELMEFVERG